MDAGGEKMSGRCLPIAGATLIILAAMLLRGTGLSTAAAPDDATAQGPTSQSTSSMKVEGDLVRIEGRYYVVKTAEGKELYLLVNEHTELAGSFKPGDHILIWTSPVEHAIAIRAKVSESVAQPIEIASRHLKGRLIAIRGMYYVILGNDGKERQLLVSDSTELAGEFKPGDMIEVFTAPLEYAVTIKTAQ